MQTKEIKPWQRAREMRIVGTSEEIIAKRLNCEFQGSFYAGKHGAMQVIKDSFGKDVHVPV